MSAYARCGHRVRSVGQAEPSRYGRAGTHAGRTVGKLTILDHDVATARNDACGAGRRRSSAAGKRDETKAYARRCASARPPTRNNRGHMVHGQHLPFVTEITEPSFKSNTFIVKHFG
jgi:hypothetical protein